MGELFLDFVLVVNLQNLTDCGAVHWSLSGIFKVAVRACTDKHNCNWHT